LENYAFYNNQLSEIVILIVLGVSESLHLERNKAQQFGTSECASSHRRNGFYGKRTDPCNNTKSVTLIKNYAFSNNKLAQVVLGENTKYYYSSFDNNVEIIGGEMIG
jgi:hypothetical protein